MLSVCWGEGKTELYVARYYANLGTSYFWLSHQFYYPHFSLSRVTCVWLNLRSALCSGCQWVQPRRAAADQRMGERDKVKSFMTAFPWCLGLFAGGPLPIAPSVFLQVRQPCFVWLHQWWWCSLVVTVFSGRLSLAVLHQTFLLFLGHPNASSPPAP